jgi:hypothetical protein
MHNDTVYLLWHTDAYEDERLIGVYRTEEDALIAMDRTKEKPGFSDEGGRFEMAKYELNPNQFLRPLSCGLGLGFIPSH